LLPDLVELWVREQVTIWTAPWTPPPAPQVSAPAKPLRAGELPPPHGAPRQLAQPGTGPALDPGQFPPTTESPEAAARRRLAAQSSSTTSLARKAPPRPLRQDPPPAAGSGKRLVMFLRAGVELRDGFQTATGDRVVLEDDEARDLVKAGAADFVAEAAP
jgi:hypothetical protein